MKLRPADGAVVAYVLSITLLLVLAWGRVPDVPAYLAKHWALAAGVLVMAWIEARRDTRFVRFIRAWDLILYKPAFFVMALALVGSVNPSRYDDTLLALDRTLGADELLRWLAAFERPWLNDVMQTIWILYILLPVLAGVEMYLRRSAAAFHQGKAILVTAWLISFLGYYAAPAEGVGYHVHKIDVPPLGPGGGVLETLKEHQVRVEGLHALDAFPSGHTIVSLVVILMCVIYRLRVRWVAVPYGVLVILSTLYLRYHYLMDILAAIVVAVAVTWVGRRVIPVPGARAAPGLAAPQPA